MQLTLLKSKIHRATVTGASLDYEGSLTVSADIAQTVGLLAYEKLDRRRSKDTSATDCRARPAKQNHPLRTRRDAHQPKRMGNGSFAGEQSPIHASLPSAAIST
jgi:Aspartate decarboxylase